MRTKINFDNNWRFCIGDFEPKTTASEWGGAKVRGYLKGVVAPEFDDSDWRVVDLPHDYVSEGKYCFKNDVSDMGDIPEMESISSRLMAAGCLEGKIAWYRKHFTVNEDLENRRIYIHFDGIYRNSTVYINRYLVGSHTSGYGGFYYDITDFVSCGDNVIAIRVDSREHEGWWYEGGGIYRHTWLEAADNIHTEPFGLYAAPCDIDTEAMTALIKIRCTAVCKYTDDRDAHIRITVKDPNGNMIAVKERDIRINAWSSADICEELSAENIRLWDLNNAELYTAEVCINDSDTYQTTFGIRDIRFDADKGLFLNGKHIKVNGVCCHYDHAGVGVGIPDTVNRYRLERIKDLGANALRLSHYPPSAELLDMCDRMGILVFSETRRMSSAPEDIDSLRFMIKNGRNHPSVFLWGIGNEEIFSQHRPETARTTKTLKSEIRRLDILRPVTSAVVCWDGEQRFDNARGYIDVTKNLDVMGFNYCHTAWDDYHSLMPDQPVIVTEESSNSGTRGCTQTDESKGLYCIYDKDNEAKCKSGKKAVKADMGETAVSMVMERDYIAGMFVWTGFDYRGEPTPFGYPAVYSQFGIMDYCGFEKDNFYYYRSRWTDDTILHIFRCGTDVYCYTSCNEAELFADGKSLGRKSMNGRQYLVWENCADNDLKAIGYKNGNAVITDIKRPSGKPQRILAESYYASAKKGDAVIVNISILDENGVLVENADNTLTFDIEGGILLGTGNGAPADHDSEKAMTRRAFNGRCQLIVKAAGKKLRILVSSAGLDSAVCEPEIK